MDQLGFNFTPQRRIFSVSELTFAIRTLFEDQFADVWVSGEISNVRKPGSGHYYFTLKDGDAQLRCVCFRQKALYLKVKPQDGLEVVARGPIGVYEARGEYQLYVEAIEPLGYGALQLAFEQLKKKLAAEGLFDDARKRPLPRFPARVGIVTSATGAAVADMIRVMERRCPGLHIRLFPARVQGEDAAADIVRGIDWFSQNEWADVVIVGRGGGSLEDLWAFNEEPVARAIADCRVPVVSGVGHQTDFTIADFVADARAPTPSAAAEIVAPDRAEQLGGVLALRERAVRAIRYRFSTAARRLVEAGVERPAGLIQRRIQSHWQRNDELEQRLGHAAANRVRTGERRFRRAQHRLAELDLRVNLTRESARRQDLERRLAGARQRLADRAAARLEVLSRKLETLNPAAILERGYAIVSDPHNAIVRDASKVGTGDDLSIRLHRGRMDVRVTDVRVTDTDKLDPSS